MPMAQDSAPPVAATHDESTAGDTEAVTEIQKTSGIPRSSSGWDGKLRVDKNLTLANPEALSDPEYSDEENVVPGETINADEGEQA